MRTNSVEKYNNNIFAQARFKLLVDLDLSQCALTVTDAKLASVANMRLDRLDLRGCNQVWSVYTVSSLTEERQRRGLPACAAMHVMTE